MKILLVEDDPSTREFLKAVLTAHRYVVDTATDGQVGFEMASQLEYDLIILDVLIPKLDGMSICRSLRQQHCQVPILMLTAKADDEDITAGLDSGADDYVIKPCTQSQLMARIRALLRRKQQEPTNSTLRWGDLALDVHLLQVTYGSQVVQLSPKQYALLELLLRNPQRIFSRDAIIDHLWSIDDYPSHAAVTNLIKDLRQRLKATGMNEELIDTVYRLGYRLNPPPVAQPNPISEQTEGQPEKAGQESLAALEIEEVAQHFREAAQQRLYFLEGMVRSLPTHPLTLEQQTQARLEAHRLVGAMGTFGYEQGSDLARTLETLLNQEGPFSEFDIFQMADLVMRLQRELALPASISSGPFPSNVSFKGNTIRIWVLGNPNPYIPKLQQVAAQWNMSFQKLDQKAETFNLLEQETPDAVLLISTEDALYPAFEEQVQSLKAQYPELPTVLLFEQDTLDNRLLAARLGSTCYLAQNTPVDRICEAIAHRLQQGSLTEARIMVVDDDPLILEFLSKLLGDWGFYTTGLSDPTQFWDVLTQTQPDVLLLDLEMPDINGLVLCQMVRQDPLYGDLPVLFVTAQDGSDTVQQVFAAGADDFIRKPILAPELVTRIISRLERSRVRQQRQNLVTLVQDKNPVPSLVTRSTNLVNEVSNRFNFETLLATEWQRARGSHTRLSLLYVEVNEKDRVAPLSASLPSIQDFTQILKDSIQPTDGLAYWGDRQWMILLPNTDIDGALRVGRWIRRAIATALPPSYHLTLGGTSTLPQEPQTLQSFVKTAEQAMAIAKQQTLNTDCFLPFA